VTAPRARGRLTLALRILFGAAFLLYPLIVWYALSRGSPRSAAIVALCLVLPVAIVRLRGQDPRALGSLALVPFFVVIALTLSLVLDHAGFVLAVPAMVNAMLLFAFASTLRRGSVPMIERFARLQLANPTPDQVRWCRDWTWIWCRFFVLNGVTAAALAIWAPIEWWAIYNGGLAYVGIGALLAIEWTLRRRRFGPT